MPYLFSSASLLLSNMCSFVSPFRLACVLFSNPFFFFFSFVLSHMTCLSFPTPSFSSSYLPLSLPRLPCVSPLDCHVRCCCAVDKTQSLSHHPAPGIFGYCSVVGVSMWERQWEADKQGKRQKERKKKCRMPFIHQNWSQSQVANLMFLNFLWLYKNERNYIILKL